jgi:hypothetical protein
MYATRALTGGTKGLYEIDVVQDDSNILKPITGGVGDVDNGTGYTNGLAYDPFDHKLYFTAPPRVNVSPSPLWSYDISTGQLTKLMDLPDSVVGGSFYNGAYYYIAEGVNSLMKVEVNSLPCVPTVVCSGFGTASDFTFGDFAISRRGILYGSTRVSPQMFFSLDLASCEYYEFTGSNALDLQLAYGSDGKLYGINHGSGNSYEINVGTGMAIPISFNFVGAADLASGELGVPTTESAWAATGIGQLPFDGKNWATYFTYTHDGCFILNITAVNGNTGYTHYFTISYDPDTKLFTGTGTGAGGDETLSNIVLKDNVISFRSDYDAGSYYWLPSFVLEDNGTLTFVEKTGDNVTSATGTWDITYDCNGD